MKRLLLAAIAFAWAGTAEAGVYHVGRYLYCYDCHTMHASQSRTYSGSGTVSTVGELGGNWLPNAGSPQHALLKGAGSASCLGCHDNRPFAPDVVDGATATQMPRSAGAFPTTSGGGGHALNGSAPPGGSMTGTLQCTSCHIQHGYASYRNLGSRSNAAITPTMSFDATKASDGVTDVIISGFDATVGYVPALSGDFGGYYKMGSVRYQALTVTPTGGAAIELTNRMNNFCGSCHGQFHGEPGDAAIGGEDAALAFPGETGYQAGAFAEFLRHPTAGVYVGQVSIHGHSTPPTLNTDGTARDSFYNVPNRVKAAVTTGAPTTWPANGYGNGMVAGERATPMCISCHNAHGSSKPFGLRFLIAKGTESDLENGSGKYRNLCGQCHSQGSKTVETYPAGYTGIALP